MKEKIYENKGLSLEANALLEMLRKKTGKRSFELKDILPILKSNENINPKFLDELIDYGYLVKFEESYKFI